MDLLFLFEWFDQSLLASVAKAYGGVFAMVQTVHLASLALLGGMMLTMDLRLLNILMRDVDLADVEATTTYWINVALVSVTLSGIFQSAAVSIKLYYNEFFWAKVAGFAMGIAFMYLIKRPLVRRNSSPAYVHKLVAIASLTIWFGVAATGRWIGFS